MDVGALLIAHPKAAKLKDGWNSPATTSLPLSDKQCTLQRGTLGGLLLQGRIPSLTLTYFALPTRSDAPHGSITPETGRDSTADAIPSIR